MSDSKKQKLRRAFQRELGTKQDVLQTFAALMGDGNGNTDVPGRSGYVWVRVGHAEVLQQAFNMKVTPRDNLPITVGYTSDKPRMLQVIDIRQEAYVDSGQTAVPSVAPHHDSHEWGGGDDVWVSWRRIIELHVGQPVGFTVTVSPGIIYRSGAYLYAAAQTINLAAHQPTLGGQARYVLVYLDAAGVVGARPGTIRTSITALLATDIPVPLSTEVALAAVRLYTSQTAISDLPTNQDIFDLRELQVYPGAGVTGWELAGNTSTNPPTDFLGTTDNQPLYIKVNSKVSGVISPQGGVVLDGNARGTGAIEFQTTRSVATRVASGNYSIAIGSDNTASSLHGIAIGWMAEASVGICALAIGTNAKASGLNAISIGGVGVAQNLASAENSIAIGGMNTASGKGSIAIGIINTTSGQYSIGVGYNANTNSKTGAILLVDSSDTVNAFTASVNHEFAVRATGGVRLVTAISGAGAATYQMTVSTAAVTLAKKIGAAGIQLDPNAATGDFELSLSPANLTASRRVIFPDGNITFLGGGVNCNLQLPNSVIVLAGGGASNSLTLPNAAITLAGGGASCTLTLPNAAVSITGGGAGCTLALPNAGTTITGGGTLALGGFTATIPATDTVAMLGVANVFTADQTISNAAPSFALTDTTGGAKSLTIAVDANLANIRESAGAAGSLVLLDLANNKFGVGVSSFTANGGVIETANGITFPAVQSACSNVNTLDDYEEGDITVTLTCGTSGTITLNASYNTLSYTKIGRLVTVTGFISVDSVNSPVGTLTLNGLPFTCANATKFYSAISIYASALAATAVTSITGYVIYNTTTVRICKFAAGVFSNLAGDVQANSVFAFSIQYFTT